MITNALKKIISNLLILINELKLFIFGKPKYKQELLLRKALKEKGFNSKKLKISCDHINGFNYVNNVKLGIKYPDSFYYKSRKLIPTTKIYNFYFNGNMSDSGKRAILLKPFLNFTNSKIISSNDGRIQSRKDKFNYKYFYDFSFSKFGLCPHQMDWKGDRENMWTYRFIEACFVDAIPVLFVEAPLGKNFIEGFNYIWNYEFFNIKEDSLINKFSISHVKNNQQLAKSRFCLSAHECNLISNTL